MQATVSYTHLYQWLTQKYPRFLNTNNYKHLGTLGTGNHFIEICLDESDQVDVYKRQVNIA